MPRTSNLDDGLQHYRVLGLPCTANQDDIKQAYRQLARVLHPDKGGSSAAFAALQTAFETLIDPKTRSVYDALAADVRFRPGAAAPYNTANQAPDHSDAPPPGVAEAVLLQQLLRNCGSSIDPYKQLCVTCEVCRRPATKECWTCRMAICDFCTRRQHWKGSVPLHWPLVNAPGRMVEQLGKQEFEQKRKEDALEYKKKQPGYRPQFEMQLLRQFQDAICDLLKANKQQGVLPAPATNSHGRRSSTLPALPALSRPAAAAAARPTAGAFALPAAASSAYIKPTLPAISSNSSNLGQLVTTNSSRQLVDTNSSSTRALAIPGNSSSINKCLRAWLAAGPEAIRVLQATYDYRLARFYMWAQSEASILLAVHMPTGGTSKPPKLDIQVTATTLTLQHQGFAPVLSRCWSHPVDSSQGVTSWVSADGQLVCLVTSKAQPGMAWNTCFKGDSHAARCLQSPYSLLQLPCEVQIELPLPFWVVPEEDLEVTVNDKGVTVIVDGVMQLRRGYWRHEGQAAKLGSNYKVVNVDASNWCVLDQQKQQSADYKSGIGPQQQQCRPRKILSISLSLPELTLEEIQYKKGVRQNNAAASRSCPYGYDDKGYTFFADDEDEFGLGPVLQALMFHEAGYSWITPEPWEIASGAVTGAGFSERGDEGYGLGGRWVRDEKDLPGQVQKHLKWLRAAAGGGADALEE